MATYSADISVKVVGLTALTSLEKRVEALHKQFTKINAAAANVTAPFQNHIRALERLNVLLESNGRLLNQQAQAVQRMDRVASSTSRGPAKQDPRILREQQEAFARQIQQLKQRADLLENNRAITDKLRSATEQLISSGSGNVRLGKELLKNARALLVAEEQLANQKAKDAAQAIKDAEAERVARLKTVADLGRAEAQMASDLRKARKQDQRDREQGQQQRGSVFRTATGIAGRTGGAVDRAFGGAFSAVGKAAEGAVIRGGAAAGVMGIGGMLSSMQNFEVFGKHLPEITGAAGAVTDLVAALGNLPGGLGAAAVAAAAFAPWLPKIAQGALEAGEAVGKLEAAKPLKNLLNQGGASFYESPVNALSGNLDMALDASGYEKAGAAAGAAFSGRFNAALLGKLGQGMLDQLQKQNDDYFATLKKNERINANWAAVLEEGAAHQAEITRKAQAEAAARAESLASLRATEAARSETARKNLETAAAARRNAVPEVVRRPVAGVAYPNGAAPAASPTAVEGSVVNQVKRVTALKKNAAEEVARIERDLSISINNTEIEHIKNAMEMELDSIEQVAAARKKAGDAWWAQQEKRLRQKPDVMGPAFDKGQREKAKERDKARGDKLESIALGVGFPLMFGAGPGSIAGSFAGSFVGSGFGGQILGGAIGTMFDQLGTAAREAGNALRDPIANFEALKTAGIFASSAQEHLIERLIELGRVTEATERIQAQVIQKIGVNGARDLQRLDQASDKLAKAWAELNLQMQAAVAGPLATLLEWITAVVGLVGERNAGIKNTESIAQGLSPKDREQFLKELQKNAEGIDAFSSDLQARRAKQQEIQQRYAAKSNQPALKTEISPAELQKAAETRLAAAERAAALDRQGIQLARQQQDARLQIEDQIFGLRRRAEDLQRAGTDLRRSVEDEIFRKRQELARIESDNAREQARLAIERLDMQLQGLQVSGNVPGQDIANGLVNAVRQYVKTRAEAEADFQQKERNFKIEMVELEKASDRFAFEVSRKVADLQRQSADYTRDVQRAVLNAERTIYDLQIAAADYRVAKAKEAIALEDQAASRVEQTQQLTGQVQAGSGSGGGYISKEVLRKWLISQGMGRTSGDFTNAGHKTPNHMLNAMDMGFTASKYDHNYVQKTKEMEAKLRATGAFGDQLFGPTRDPRGHKDHLHVPTPGGMVRNTPGLQALMGNRVPAATAAANPSAAAASAAVPSATPRSVDTSGALAGLSGLRAPAVGGVGDLMAANAQLDTSIAKAKQLGLELAKAYAGMTKEGAALAMEQQVKSAIDQLNAPMDQLLKSQQDQLAYQREYAGLIMDGVSPALAEQLSKIREQVQLQLQQLDTSIAALEATKVKLEAEKKWTGELQAQLDLLKAQRGVIEGKGQQGEATAISNNSTGQRLQDAYTKVKGQLTDLIDPVNQITAGAEAIGSAFAESFKGVASGAMTAQEALANFFQRTADHFLDMAAQMIAKYLEMKVLGLALNVLGGLTGGSSGPGLGLGDAAMFSPMPSYAGGGSTGDGARAGGLDGQGGFMAMLHPQETVIDHWSVNRDTLGSVGSQPGDSPYEENQQALAARDRAFSENQQLITQNTVLNRERTMERERAAAMAGGYEPIEVNVNAVDPASTGLVTVEQLAQSSQMAVKQAQAQLLKKFKNNPAVRAGAGL